jgi:hypothetical protein
MAVVNFSLLQRFLLVIIEHFFSSQRCRRAIYQPGLPALEMAQPAMQFAFRDACKKSFQFQKEA